MTLDWKSQAIEQLSWHWEGQLRPRLEGLTDDEYFWEPVKGCWTIHHRDEKRTPMQVGKGEMVFDSRSPRPTHRRSPRLRGVSCILAAAY